MTIEDDLGFANAPEADAPVTVYPFRHRKQRGDKDPIPLWDALKVLEDVKDLKRRVAQLEEAQVKNYVTMTTTGSTIMDPR